MVVGRLHRPGKDLDDVFPAWTAVTTPIMRLFPVTIARASRLRRYPSSCATSKHPLPRLLGDLEAVGTPP